MAKRSVRNFKRRVSSGDRRSGGAITKPVEIKKARYLFTVRISGYPVPVFLTKKFQDPDITGQYVQVLDEIYVIDDKNMSQARYTDTVLHEVLHAVSHIALSAKDRLNERQVNTVATVLADTFRRSPEFREVILNGASR